MTLHPNWKQIIMRAWSIRWLVVAGALSGVDALLQGLIGAGYVTTGLSVFSGLATAAAFVARIVAQKGFDDA